jgi:hypothetical protein
MWMGPEREANVEVPRLIGLAVVDAQRIAATMGVKLSTGDPDGPPLSALTWQRDCYITEQRPPPGSLMRKRGSLEVDYQEVPPDDLAGVREPRRPLPQIDGPAVQADPRDETT